MRNKTETIPKNMYLIPKQLFESSYIWLSAVFMSIIVVCMKQLVS